MVSTSFPRGEVVEGLVRDACMAPSLDNAQPWRFRYSRGGDSLTLRADPGRAVAHSDPQQRALHLACGAALFNLRVAAQNAGFRPVVTLLPDPDDWQTLASVSLREPAQTFDPDLSLLYKAITERRTSSHPFAERPIPAGLADLLIGQARAEGARMAFLSGWHLSLVLDVIEEAELGARYTAGPGVPDGPGGRGSADGQRWARTGVTLSDAVAHDDPERVAAPRAEAGGGSGGGGGGGLGNGSGGSGGLGGGSGLGSAPVRDFTRGRSEPAAGALTAEPEPLPHLGLLCTERDHPDDWLLAGQAMERMVLRATREGLATSFATQALARPELRWLLRDPVWGAGPVQMVIRLGYGRLGAPTSRRPVGQVLEVTP